LRAERSTVLDAEARSLAWFGVFMAFSSGTTPGKLARALSGPYPISDTAMRRATLFAAVDVQDSAAVDR
jgi:hypothetical protein